MIPELLLEKARQKGTDKDYQAWARQFPSLLSYIYSEYLHGQGVCEFSHVRRVSGGAGIAIKSEYSGVPLTHAEHALIHQKGESVFYPQEWWEQQAISYLTMWVNGVNPPEQEVIKKRKKQEYTVTSAGHLKALELMLVKYFANPKATPIRVTIEKYRENRTKQQNRAMWGVIYRQIIEYYIDNPIDLGRDMIESINFGLDENSIHEMCKRLFNDNLSTRTLNKEQHSAYFERIFRRFDERGYKIKPPVSNNGDNYF